MQLCIRPYKGEMEYKCGGCLVCKMSHRRLWANRLILESRCHDWNAFVTLTKAEDADELSPEELKAFNKRLLQHLGRPFRFFAVGEYGSLHGRPHYHLALFGVSWLEKEVIEKAWSKDGKLIGFVDCQELNERSAAYIAGYCVEKFMAPAPEGKEPPFVRMSNGGRTKKGGIGAGAVDIMVKQLLANPLALSQLEDVVTEVRIAGKKVPLGRYLRRRMRLALTGEAGLPQFMLQRMVEEFRSMSSEDKEKLQVRRLAKYEQAKARIAIARSKKVF